MGWDGVGWDLGDTCKAPGLIGGHGPQVPQVALVAHQHDDDVGIGVVLQLLQPALGVFVRQVLGDVVDQQSPHGPPVIPGGQRGDGLTADSQGRDVGFGGARGGHSRRGDGSVPLLPGRVPNLSFHRLVVHLDAPRGELHPDGALALQVELIAGEAGQEVALPHAGVPDEHNWIGEGGGTNTASAPGPPAPGSTNYPQIIPSPAWTWTSPSAPISFSSRGNRGITRDLKSWSQSEHQPRRRRGRR